MFLRLLKSTTTFAILGLTVGAILILTSCSKEQPRTDLTGKVTSGGQLLKGGRIFLKPEQGDESMATIAQDGTFRFTDLPKGKYTVRVETAYLKTLVTLNGGNGITAAPPAKGEKVAPKIGPQLPDSVQIDPKYEKYETSGLNITLDGKTKEHTFECP